MTTIRPAESDADIVRCFPVMHQLRPHLRPERFVARIRAMQSEGFTLAYLEDDAGSIRAVSGFRVQDMLAHGRTLYVDDLVTDAESRSLGYGRQMLDWLLARALDQGCQMFSLDSGTQRHEAHHFYFRQRMRISSYHFSRPLADPPA